jgi:methionyl aminopeptidase
MRHAGLVNRMAIEYGFEVAEPGMTKRELGHRLGEFIRSYDCEPAFLGYLNFPGEACICLTEEIVHGVPDDRVIQDGDILTIDIGTKYNGWNVDAAYTDIIGKAKPETIKFVRECESIFNEMIKHVHPQFSLYQLAELGDRLVAPHNIHLLNDFCGHGIGQQIHMDPNIFHSLKGLDDRTINTLKTALLPVGSTVCVEPIFISQPNVGHVLMEDGWTWRSKYDFISAHFENTLLITENGTEIIS